MLENQTGAFYIKGANVRHSHVVYLKFLRRHFEICDRVTVSFARILQSTNKRKKVSLSLVIASLFKKSITVKGPCSIHFIEEDTLTDSRCRCRRDWDTEHSEVTKSNYSDILQLIQMIDV